jgi:hypothetical protein
MDAHAFAGQDVRVDAADGLESEEALGPAFLPRRTALTEPMTSVVTSSAYLVTYAR